MAAEQLVHHRQQQLGMALAGVRLAGVDRAVAPERNRAVFGGGVESEDLNPADEYYHAVRASV